MTFDLNEDAFLEMIDAQEAFEDGELLACHEYTKDPSGDPFWPSLTDMCRQFGKTGGRQRAGRVIMAFESADAAGLLKPATVVLTAKEAEVLSAAVEEFGADLPRRDDARELRLLLEQSSPVLAGDQMVAAGAALAAYAYSHLALVRGQAKVDHVAETKIAGEAKGLLARIASAAGVDISRVRNI